VRDKLKKTEENYDNTLVILKKKIFYKYTYFASKKKGYGQNV